MFGSLFVSLKRLVALTQLDEPTSATARSGWRIILWRISLLLIVCLAFTAGYLAVRLEKLTGTSSTFMGRTSL